MAVERADPRGSHGARAALERRRRAVIREGNPRGGDDLLVVAQRVGRFGGAEMRSVVWISVFMAVRPVPPRVADADGQHPASRDLIAKTLAVL